MMLRRGFSLIEALAATALLAMVAAACVPILRAAAASAHPPVSTVDIGALGAVADLVAAHPADYGLALPRSPAAQQNDPSPMTIESDFAWPQAVPIQIADGEAPQVHAALLFPTDGQDSAGRWLVVSCDGTSSTRWIEAPRSERKRRQSPRVTRRRGTRHLPGARRVAMARGMTLVETLAALAITALLALAVVGWTVTSVRIAAGAERRVRADAAAESTIRLIREDLLTGDFAPPERARGARSDDEPPRVRASDGLLSISGRRPSAGRGETVRRYMLDARTRSLVAMDLAPGQDAQRPRPQDPVVARDVAEFRVREERADDRRKAPAAIVVTVRIEGGDAVTRRIPVP